MRKSLDMRDERIKALIRRQPGQLRRESDTAEASRGGGLLQSELEASLPADVPLHKRGFGVMDDALP
jgi:hypothetical protein